MSTAIVRRCLSELTGTLTPFTDNELLARFTSKNDDEAFATLVHRHGPIVLATCQRVLGSSQDAEDAFQAVFLALVRSASSICRPVALPAWLHRTAIRNALRIKAQRVPATSLPVGTADPSDLFADVAWRDLRVILDEELDRLPERYRLPLVLCLLDGCTRDEAAAQLRCSLNTVKRRLDAGRAILRERLLRRGVAPIVLAVGVLEQTGARAAVPPGLIATTIKAAKTVSASMGIQLFGTFAVRWKTVLLAALGLAAISAAIGIASFPTTTAPEVDVLTSATSPKAASLSADPEKSVEEVESLPSGVVAQFGTLRYRVPDHITSSALSSDGKLLAVASGYSQVRVYDVAAWRLIHSFLLESGHEGWNLPTLAFSPDGRYLGFILNGQDAYLWNLPNGRLIHRFDSGSLLHWLRGFCAFTPDGLFVLSDKEKLYFHNPATGQVVRSVAAGSVGHLTPDGRFYIRYPKHVRERKHTTENWLDPVLGDADTGKDLLLTADSTRWVSGSDGEAFAPDSKTFAVNAEDGSGVDLWSINPIKHITRLSSTEQISRGHGVGISPGFLDFTPNGRTVFLCIANGDVVRWDTRTYKELPRLKAGDGPHPVGLHALPDGKRLLTPCENGWVRLWEAESGKEIPIPDRYRDAIGMAITQDGKTVAVSDNTGRIDLRNAYTGAVLRTLQEPGYGAFVDRNLASRFMVFNQGGDLLAVTECGKEKGKDGDRISYGIRVLRVADGTTVRTMGKVIAKRDFWWVSPIGFSPDSQRLLIASPGFVRWWNLKTGEEGSKLFTGSVDSDEQADISPDGKIIVQNTGDGIILNDAVTGRILNRVAAPSISGAYHPFTWTWDSRTLACVLSDNKVVILDPATGRERRRFAVFASEQQQHIKKGMLSGFLLVSSLHLSPDGKWLAATTFSTRVARIYECATGQEIAALEMGYLSTSAHFAPENRDLLLFGGGVGQRWNLVAALAPNPKATATELWNTLCKADAKEAIRAANGLIATAIGRDLLREKLSPIKLDVTKTEVSKWITDLADPTFATREAAEKELALRARCWETLLRESARTTDNAEVRDRLMRVLAPLEKGLTKDELLASRVVRAAEMAGTAEAIELLKNWSHGVSGAILTEDAKAALDRIDQLIKQKLR